MDGSGAIGWRETHKQMMLYSMNADCVSRDTAISVPIATLALIW